MKKYIRASLSESTPDWLRKSLTHGWGNSLKNKLINKYHIALDKASYSDQPTADSIPIYNLATDYGTVVYCPGTNDDETAIVNGRQRKLGSIAKSKLPEMAVDVVYIDLTDADTTFSVGERYRDPRYTYRYDPQGKYAGQYRKQEYDYDTREYKDAGWSAKGMTPSNESRARDKSGYIIPSPEQRLAKYYKKFPERLTNKVDALYQKLIETRQMLTDADFNAPKPSWRDTERVPNIDVSKAYRRFADAVDDYRGLLSELAYIDKSYDKSYEISKFANTVRDITVRVDDVQKILNGEDVW